MKNVYLDNKKVWRWNILAFRKWKKQPIDKPYIRKISFSLKGLTAKVTWKS